MDVVAMGGYWKATPWSDLSVRETVIYSQPALRVIVGCVPDSTAMEMSCAVWWDREKTGLWAAFVYQLILDLEKGAIFWN